jgi:deoxyhypusine synthase
VGCSSAGGIEEDLIKCLANTYEGKFELDGAELRKKGMNRIGNLLVPNDNYCLFNDWIGPVLHKMHDEQDEHGVKWTPCSVIHRLGKEIDNETSVCYWAYKNNIPIFCPSITDGSIGDMLFEHAVKRPGLVVDVVEDVKAVNQQAMSARKTGVIVLGGGMVKHHVMNANLMRNGCDYCVYVSTAQEFDGSDSGARPDEAKSWGKIRVDANPVKIYTDATLVFPLMVAQTFAKYKEAHGGRGGFTYNKGYTPSEHKIEAMKLNSDELRK